MAKPPLNYTTKIPASRTANECQALLGAGGASAVAVLYESKVPVGLTFQIATPHGPRSFSLPVNVAGVSALLRKADYPSSVKSRELSVYVTREHAERVAWRVIKDWLEAQLALIDAEMVRIEQVMLPYLVVDQGVTLWDRHLDTLWDRYLDNERKAIDA